MYDERFASIVSQNSDLSDLDNGCTVEVSYRSHSVSLTQVQFESWVKELCELICADPGRWDGEVLSCVGHPAMVREAVVREAYRCLSEIAFEAERLALLPLLFDDMKAMVLYCRNLLAELEGANV